MPDVQKYIGELLAFLFFLVVFVWILRNAKEFNQVLTGASQVYVNTFQGLTKGA